MDLDIPKRYDFCVVIKTTGGNDYVISELSLTMVCPPTVEIIAKQKLVTKVELIIDSTSKFVKF